MSQLRQMAGAFAQADVDVAVVTLFDRETTKGFRDAYQLPYPCLPDPERKVYEAYGVGRIGKGAKGIGRMVARSIRLAFAGAPLRRPKEDVRQLGAEFLVGKDLRLLMAHYPETADGHLTPSGVKEVLGRAGRGAGS